MVSVVFPQTLCLQRESSSDPLTGEEEAASWKETARQRLVQEERRGQEAQLKVSLRLVVFSQFRLLVWRVEPLLVSSSSDTANRPNVHDEHCRRHCEADGLLKSGPVLCEGARHVRISENSRPERRDVESKFLGS